MCIGVPTIVWVIIASGLQNPRSVSSALLFLSSWMDGREDDAGRLVDGWVHLIKNETEL